MSDALRTSVLPPSAKGPAPAMEPTVVKTRVMSATGAINSRARSAAARVSSRVLPGGNSTLTAVWLRSAAGMKPVGSRGTSATEPTKKSTAASMVVLRCPRHQPTAAR